MNNTEHQDVEISTENGDFVVRVYPLSAPETAQRFLNYVRGNFFEDGYFHRVLHQDNQPDDQYRIEVAQFSIDQSRPDTVVEGIEVETTKDTGLEHKAGAISMIRCPAEKLGSDFFISTGENPELNYQGRRWADGKGFSVFGEIVEGMEVVRRIHDSPRTGQKLTPLVMITGAREL